MRARARERERVWLVGGYVYEHMYVQSLGHPEHGVTTKKSFILFFSFFGLERISLKQAN